MPLYSEVISDESILQILKDKYQTVLLIGCGACMNESLAYRYDLPITKNSTSVPFATVNELIRLADLLNKNGYYAKIKFYNDLNGFFCMENISVDNYPVENLDSFDIILILSCSAGYMALCDKNPYNKIVKITKPLGSIFYAYEDKDDQRQIVKSESQIIPLR